MIQTQMIGSRIRQAETKVRHNGKVWISDIDFNVFEPGVAGWEVIE